MQSPGRVFGDYVNTSFVDLLRHDAPDLLPRARRDPGRRGGAARHAGRAPRHHGPGAALPRRRHHGRRPAGHRGLPGRPPPDREDLQDRRPLRRSASPARPVPPWRWPACSRPSSSTTRRSRATSLSLEGKANKLGQMIRMNLPMAMQGLVVVPIFAGFDERARRGAASSSTTSPAGGTRRPTTRRQGSGGKDARTPSRSCSGATCPGTRRCAGRSRRSIDAADEDVGTGGPDFMRGIFPTVKTITRAGFSDVAEDEMRAPVRGRPGRRGDRGADRCRCPTTSRPSR